MYRTVDAMWRAAGDTSTDFNFYTKRGILAGRLWLHPDALVQRRQRRRSATEEFLAARIENVMQFEKFKAKAKEALSNFPLLPTGRTEAKAPVMPAQGDPCLGSRYQD